MMDLEGIWKYRLINCSLNLFLKIVYAQILSSEFLVQDKMALYVYQLKYNQSLKILHNHNKEELEPHCKDS